MLVKAVVEVGAANGSGDVEYFTLTGNKPALEVLPMGVGRLPLIRRGEIALASSECPLTCGVTVGAGGKPKKPPSITNGTPPVLANVDSSKLFGVELPRVCRPGTM